MSGTVYKSDLVPEVSLPHHRIDAFAQCRIAFRLECNGPAFGLLHLYIAVILPLRCTDVSLDLPI